MKRVSLKRAGAILGGGTFLMIILLSGASQAFVSPQDYEKIKMEKEQKARESEKVQPREPVRIQVHQPSPVSQPPTGKTGSK